MDIPIVNLEDGIVSSLGPTKRTIILILKKERKLSLKDLANEIEMSKMGVLKHVNKLVELGIVQRVYLKEGVGRPRLHLMLTEKASELFPTSYSEIAISILEYIMKNYGREDVIKALQNRADTTYQRYLNVIEEHIPLEEKIQLITELRDKDGYMAEFNVGGSMFEILEYNCPLLDVAAEYKEACEIERRMFEDLTGASVATSHQIVGGDQACKFTITFEK